MTRILCSVQPSTIEAANSRAQALSAVVQALAAAGQFTLATDLARTIEAANSRAQALSAVAQALAAAGQFTPATDLACWIEQTHRRAHALRVVAVELERANDSRHLRALVAQSWLQAVTYQELWQLLRLSHRLIIADSTLLPALLSATDWVGDFLKAI